MKALITGSNSLVNQALLAKLVEMNYEVVAHYHSEDDITKELKAKYSQVKFVQADFATKEGFMNFIKQIMENETKYDVLVNAAVYYAEKNSWKVQQDFDEWQKSFAINATSAGVLMAHAEYLMQKSGVIVNISSFTGNPKSSDVEFGMYSATKAALDSLTCSYAKRWAGFVRIIGIAPGYIRSSWNMNLPESEVRNLIESVHSKKLVEPEEIAELMEQVIKNKSINATTLLIDGGLSAPII